MIKALKETLKNPDSERIAKCTKSFIKLISETRSNGSLLKKGYFYKEEIDLLNCNQCCDIHSSGQDYRHKCTISNISKYKKRSLIAVLLLYRLIIKEILFEPESFIEGDNLDNSVRRVFHDLAGYFMLLLEKELEKNLTTETEKIENFVKEEPVDKPKLVHYCKYLSFLTSF